MSTGSILVYYNAIFSYTAPQPNVVTTTASSFVRYTPGTSLTTVLSTNASFAVPSVFTTSITIPAQIDNYHLDSYPVTTSIVGSTYTSSNTTSNLPTPSAGNDTTTNQNCTTSAAVDGFSSGTTAGIAVASAIGAALIAAVVAWLLSKRRDHVTSGDGVMKTTSRGSTRAIGTTKLENGAEMAVIRSSSAIDALLPPPMEEGAIAKEMSRLDTVIRNHAHSFFATSQDRTPAGGDDLVVEQLHELMNTSRIASGHLIATLLANSKARSGAVRFLLAWTILGGIQHNGLPENTLLPPGLDECVRPSKAPVNDPSERLQLAARWRQMTGVLLRSTSRASSLSISSSQQPRIDVLASKLNRVLEIYAPSDPEGKRQHNLREIVKLGAQFGLTLLTQPTTWTFDWEERRGTQCQELILFPALLQTGDDRGWTLRAPIRYGEVQIMSVGSFVT